MRRISFALTTKQFLDGTKTVTRRKGWKHLKPGEKLTAVRKCMGLKKGERQEVLGTIKVLANTSVRLDTITTSDVKREGFPEMTPMGFVNMFCEKMKTKPTDMVNRIVFRRIEN